MSETKRKNSNNCSDDGEESNKSINKKLNKNEFNIEEIIPEKEKNKYHFNREINNQQNKFNLVNNPINFSQLNNAQTNKDDILINNSNNEINSNINFFNACFTKDGKSGWICPLCHCFRCGQINNHLLTQLNNNYCKNISNLNNCFAPSNIDHNNNFNLDVKQINANNNFIMNPNIQLKEKNKIKEFKNNKKNKNNNNNINEKYKDQFS